MSRDSPQAFDGLDKLLSFLDRVSVWTSLKGYEEKKKALVFTSRLEGPAFENYRRLTDEEKTNYSIIEASLEREFMSGGADRMQAVRQLRQRKWTKGEEPIEAFAHEIARLVDLHGIVRVQ